VLEVRRELNAGDLDALLHPPPVGAVTPSLGQIRHAHHTLAMLLAEGRKGVEISGITGYSPSRISILQGDPAFQELVAYYREQKEAVYLDVHQRLATLGMTAIEELQQRFEDRPEGFTNREVKEILESALDRSIAPAKTGKNAGAQPGGAAVSLTVNFVKAHQGPVLDLDSVEVLEGGA
jgi:hypothetical protein